MGPSLVPVADAPTRRPIDQAQICREYAEDSGVVFELWNEPVDLDETDDPVNPGKDWGRLRPVWEELLGTVRNYGATNRVLVTGGRWASDLTGIRRARLEGANIG